MLYVYTPGLISKPDVSRQPYTFVFRLLRITSDLEPSAVSCLFFYIYFSSFYSSSKTQSPSSLSGEAETGEVVVTTDRQRRGWGGSM